MNLKQLGTLAALYFLSQAAPTQTIKLICTFDSVRPMYFGVYDSQSASPVVSSTVIRLDCKGVNVVSVLSAGPSSTSGSITDRRMRDSDSGEQLAYNLFHDARGTMLFGNGTSGGSSIVTVISGVAEVEVYGIIPAGQDVEIGEYSDTVTITVMP